MGVDSDLPCVMTGDVLNNANSCSSDLCRPHSLVFLRPLFLSIKKAPAGAGAFLSKLCLDHVSDGIEVATMGVVPIR
jgi:hypothetical protein